jgi:hypothetical protein
MTKSIGRSATNRPIIIVVEKEDPVRRVIADEIRSAGFQVIECRDAERALEVLPDGAEVSLMFTDVKIPASMNSSAEHGHLQPSEVKVAFTSGEWRFAKRAFTRSHDPQSVVEVIESLADEAGPPIERK